MHTLFISYDGLTDSLGQSQIIPYLNGIVKSRKDLVIHVVSFEKKDAFTSRGGVIRDLLEENVKWHPLVFRQQIPGFSGLLNLMDGLRTINSLVKKNNIQLIHCRSYISALLVSWLVKLGQKVPYVFDIRGFWADERVDGGLWNKEKFPYNVAYSFFKKKEKVFFTNASTIVSLTHNAKNYIESNFSVTNSPVVIPCCADLAHFKSFEKKKKDQFTIGYLGSVGTWYMLEEMLDFYQELLISKPEARFEFITREPKEMIFTLAKSKGISLDQISIRSAEREEIPALISLWHASLFFIKPCFSKRASSPTKHGEIMGCGVPVVCNLGVGDLADIVEKDHAGVAVNDFTTVEYRRAINELLHTEWDVDVIRKSAQKHYLLEDAVNSYVKIYEDILN